MLAHLKRQLGSGQSLVGHVEVDVCVGQEAKHNRLLLEKFVVDQVVDCDGLFEPAAGGLEELVVVERQLCRASE